ncbi:hypothetical protein AVEN_192365-1 [Araneus ventricosus]|uniref:Uncharacterized protein n=1 Tax=Araneus ventricosus TaxID=182803 RepID=A0A4Y2JDW9_ARAVE|nr:hypothetical protein AVEN_192365-1 [Araneus ventricosus]
MNVGPYKILGQIRQRVDCLSVCRIAYLFSFETNSLRMPASGNASARKGRSETWQFAKNKFWSDFVRKQTFREFRQVLLRKRMSRGFEFVLILQTTRGSNFGLLATEVYLMSFIILVFSTCVRSIRESLGETTPAGWICDFRGFLDNPGFGLPEFGKPGFTEVNRETNKRYLVI